MHFFINNYKHEGIIWKITENFRTVLQSRKRTKESNIGLPQSLVMAIYNYLILVCFKIDKLNFFMMLRERQILIWHSQRDFHTLPSPAPAAKKNTIIKSMNMHIREIAGTDHPYIPVYFRS